MSSKAKAKPAAPPPEEESPATRAGILRGILITIVVLVVIAWGTVFLALRTAVGRDTVSGRIETRTGMECSLGSAALVFPCVIRLRDVALSEPGAEYDCVRIARFEVRRGFFRGQRVLLHDPALTLRQADDGAWHPRRLAILSAALDQEVYLIGSAVRSWGPNQRVTLRGGHIQWIHADGQTGGEVRNLDFQSHPVRIPKRSMQYHELRFTRADDAALAGAGQRAVAWLSTESTDYIEVPLAP